MHLSSLCSEVPAQSFWWTEHAQTTWRTSTSSSSPSACCRPSAAAPVRRHLLHWILGCTAPCWGLSATDRLAESSMKTPGRTGHRRADEGEEEGEERVWIQVSSQSSWMLHHITFMLAAPWGYKLNANRVASSSKLLLMLTVCVCVWVCVCHLIRGLWQGVIWVGGSGGGVNRRRDGGGGVRRRKLLTESRLLKDEEREGVRGHLEKKHRIDSLLPLLLRLFFLFVSKHTQMNTFMFKKCKSILSVHNVTPYM